MCVRVCVEIQIETSVLLITNLAHFTIINGFYQPVIKDSERRVMSDILDTTGLHGTVNGCLQGHGS